MESTYGLISHFDQINWCRFIACTNGAQIKGSRCLPNKCVWQWHFYNNYHISLGTNKLYDIHNIVYGHEDNNTSNELTQLHGIIIPLEFQKNTHYHQMNFLWQQCEPHEETIPIGIPGTRFTNNFFTVIQIRWKIGFSVTLSIVRYHNAKTFCECHDSTAVVPCTKIHSDHSLQLGWEQSQISTKFELEWKIVL